MFNHQLEGMEVGEKLFTLQQGERTMAEYALEFGPLATGSRWNDLALKVIFCPGHEANILTELACRDEQSTLDSLIDLAIKLDHLLQNWPSL